MSRGVSVGEDVGENIGITNAVLGSELFPPTGFATGTTTTSTIAVSWIAPQQGSATQYIVKDSSDDSTVATVAWPATGTIVVALSSDTTYTFYVVTADTSNESVPSNTDSGTTLPQTGTILFEENFDSHPPQDLNGRKNNDTDPNATSLILPNWDYQYSANQNEDNPPAEIVTGGITGNMLQHWEESGGSNSQWGFHDFQEAKHFKPNQYTEIWVTIWLKPNPNVVGISSLGGSKILRFAHVNVNVADGTVGNSVFSLNNTDSQNGGLGKTSSGVVFYDIKEVAGHIRHQIAIRSDPTFKAGTYDEAWEIKFKDENGVELDPNDSWSETWGDGNWHKLQVGGVYGSVAPNHDNGDGEVHVWFDDKYQGGRTDVPFRTAGYNSAATGFNYVTIGGNSNWNWAGGTVRDPNAAEQIYYWIDNVTVSTSRI